MSRLTLALLGGFRGRLASASLTLPTRKTQALVAYLALPPGQPRTRDQLASLLWGSMPQPQARRSLRQCLFTLRRALGADSEVLRLEGETVTLNPAAVEIDVIEFERDIAEGSPAALERAIALYRGELLEGLALQEPPFEEWLLAERERLRERALEALARLLRHRHSAGAPHAALQAALQLLALDPLQEPVHRMVMRLYVQLSRRGAALRQYQICLGALQRELSVEPEPATKELYREILRQRPADVAPDLEDPAPPRGGAIESAAIADEALPRELPLLGRDAELGPLREALKGTMDGQGGVAVVIGEAGVGKSRLLAELAAEWIARGARVLVGRCYEAEQILPFASWVDAFRSGHVETDKDVVAKLDAPYRTEIARLLPRVATPGHTPGVTPVDYRRLFESVAELVRLLAATRPSLLVLEDLHWGDEMTLRLLSFLARRLRAWPILVVGTVREEDLASVPLLRRTLADLARDRGFFEVRLAPLSREATRELVKTLARSARSEDVTTELAEQVWLVSEGNPFAVIEAMRARSEDGAPARLAVPQRVREVVLRHLDSLSERARALASVAAVIGREFDFALLSRSSGLDETETAEGLEELVRRRVVDSVGERFTFTHDRLREVAYDRLLAEHRRAVHARIVGVMEALYAERIAEEIERLAHHAARGGLGARAVMYLREAGAKAFANSAHADARAYLVQALELLEARPASTSRDREELALRLALGPVIQATRGHATAEVEQNYVRARQLAGDLGTPVQQFQALWGTWLVASHRASADSALDLGRQLLGLAQRLDAPALLLEGHHALWPVLVWRGRPAEARSHLDRGMALYDKARHRSHAFMYGGHDPGVCCLKVASWVSWILGTPTRGLEESVASLDLARELDHPTSMIVALVWACVFRDLRREVDAAANHARALITLSKEHETAQWLAVGTIMEAAARVDPGHVEVTINRIRGGLAAYEATGAHLFVPYFLSLLARAYLQGGQAHEGLRVVVDALQRARTTGERVWEAELLRLEGELRLAASSADRGAARDCFHRAIEVAREQAARAWELRAASSLARLLAADGRRDEARHIVGGVYAGFTEGFETADLEDARALLSGDDQSPGTSR
jgi:DNA-binding SARP family transcriptional activator/predicted ATPase